jgi:hypothetical protein
VLNILQLKTGGLWKLSFTGISLSLSVLRSFLKTELKGLLWTAWNLNLPTPPWSPLIKRGMLPLTRISLWLQWQENGLQTMNLAQVQDFWILLPSQSELTNAGAAFWRTLDTLNTVHFCVYMYKVEQWIGRLSLQSKCAPPNTHTYIVGLQLSEHFKQNLFSLPTMNSCIISLFRICKFKLSPSLCA